MAVAVKGLRELSAAFAKADKEQKRGLPLVLRKVAEPVKREAEGLAIQKISRIGERWSQMRIGVTRRLVYAAPKRRGVKARGPHPRRRPNLAPLLAERAMEPALQRHEADIERAVERALDQLADNFNRGGPIS
jgi:hypothetical protein